MLQKLLRQTSDKGIEAGLRETRPFFLFLVLVLIFLYLISVKSDPALRQSVRIIPYTFLFLLHLLLHWTMPNWVMRQKRPATYLVVQIALIMAIIFLSPQPGVVVGLYMALAGETFGILEDWRLSLTATVGYLTLMGLTIGLISGWEVMSGWLGSALVIMLFVLIYVLLFLRQLNAREESRQLLTELQVAHTQLADYAQRVESLTLAGERQRMARELHDTLAQGLTGLALQLEAVEASLERENTVQALQITAQAKDRVRMTLADARRAIDDLRASETAVLESINREVERFTAASGLPCRPNLPLQLNLSRQNGEHLVRFVSEGLTNIARHAHATQVWLTV
ncbi:MAG: hypothetical protein KDE34_22140, partial [Anaerolineales bacterium]|nr:hypothetical protein [Anaerolineales bacterium]